MTRQARPRPRHWSRPPATGFNLSGIFRPRLRAVIPPFSCYARSFFDAAGHDARRHLIAGAQRWHATIIGLLPFDFTIGDDDGSRRTRASAAGAGAVVESRADYTPIRALLRRALSGAPFAAARFLSRIA